LKKQQKREKKESKKSGKKSKGSSKKESKDDDSSKDRVIENLQDWLDAGSDSISQYAPLSQVALQLEDQSSSQHNDLAEAAVYQGQSEECVRQLITVLKQCKMADKQCIKLFSPMTSTCNRYASLASNLVSKHPLHENEL